MVGNRLVAASRVVFVTSFLTVVLRVQSNSQEIPIGGMLYGEPIIGSSSHEDYEPDANFVSTSNQVYELQDGFLSAYYTPYYAPPKGKTIAHIAWKKLPSKSTYPKYRVLVIQLNDGTIIYHHFTREKDDDFIRDSVATGKVGTTQFSEGWVKLAGEALYALSSSYVYVNRDNALLNWQVDSLGLNGAHVWDIDLDTTFTVYAATDHGLFTQNPDSTAWRRVVNFTQTTNTYRVYVDRKNRILVGGNGGGVYLSTDNGTTWSVDTAGIGNQSVNLFADDVFGNVYVVTSNPPTHMYKSSGGTSSWQVIDSPMNSIAVNNININALAGDSTLVAGTSFGVFASTDQGNTWAMKNNGIKAEYFSGFLRTPTGIWVTGTNLGLFSKNPSDTSWTKRYPINGYSSRVSFAGDGLGGIYAISGHTLAGGPIVFKSTDNGTSWNPDTNGLYAVRTGVYFVDEAGGQHVGTSQYGSSFPSLFFSKPLGGSWTLDTVGFSSPNYSFSYAIASDKRGYLYVTGYYYNGSTQVNGRVMRRPIGGGAWVPDTTGLPSSINYLSNMGPDKNGNMMGTAGGTLYRRTNGTWVTVPVASQAAANFYYIDKFSVDSSGAIFASYSNSLTGGGGVYFTTNGGTSWTHAGLDSLTVTQLISYGDSTYVSTFNGIYILQRKAFGTTGVSKVTVTPMTYALLQNYPNPFNPTTVIGYQLPTTGKVSLKIYDLLGREVETLVNGQMEAGLHRVSFDASGFASGIYFYRLQAGNYAATKKLVLLK